MNTEIANALSGYFDTLFALNRNLITFCGMEAYADDPWKLHKYMQAVICFLPQLIPYSFSRNTRQYCISLNDGLMEFSDSLPFLRQDYEAILQKHYALYYRVVVFRAPLQGLCYTVRDVVDRCITPTTRWFKKGSNHSPLQFC